MEQACIGRRSGLGSLRWRWGFTCWKSILGIATCAVDRFTKRLLWNIVWRRSVSMEEYYAESMLENKFCSNVAPSLSSGPPLIYKAKYKGLISKNLYPAITFDWSVIRTWGQRLLAAFLMLFSGIPHLPTLRDTWHVTYVTHVTHVTWHMWHTQRDKR